MALTLNDTTADDNLAVFLIEMRVEGNNEIANSGFDSSSSTGWTLTGDWIIANNQLEYVWVDDASGTARYTVSTLAVDTYVFEYKVTAVSAGIGINFYLEDTGGVGTSVTAANVTLPQTLGKHSLRFVARAGTTLSIAVQNMGAGESIKIDDIKLRRENQVIRLSTKAIDLGGDNVFDGTSIQYNQISNLDAYIDVESSGGTGVRTGYSFKLKRSSTNSRVADFFNEYFPAYDGGQVVAREILFGVVWDTGTPAYADITWLMRGKVIDYSYEPRAINIIVLQSTAIEAKPAPYYSVQDDFDNEVSYFAGAPNENKGAIIPIVYGDFATTPFTSMDDFNYRYAPGIVVDEGSLEVIYASHKVDTTSDAYVVAAHYAIHKYLSGADSYLVIYKSGGTAATNNDIRYMVEMHNATGELLGTTHLRLNELSQNSDITDISNVIDQVETTNLTIDGGEKIALRVRGSTSTSEVGYPITSAATGAVVYFRIATDNGNRDWKIYYRNETLEVPADSLATTGTTGSGTPINATHEFSTSVSQKKDGDLPWTVEEIQGLDFLLENEEAPGSAIEVYRAYIYLNTKVTGAVNRYEGSEALRALDAHQSVSQNLIPMYSTITERFTINGLYTSQERLVIQTKDAKARLDNLYGYLKGREYGRWIDHINSADAAKNRTMGDVEGDLIECPCYIIESLFRDEMWTERDLVINSSAAVTTFIDTEVLVKEDDYYNYAEMFNATSTDKRNITDFVGSTSKFTINANIAGMVSDNYFLTNIQGDNKIDYATFDVVGNTTNGNRKDWKFARSINTKQSIRDLINEILFESHCIMFEAADESTGESQIKIKALDRNTGAPEFGTWALPAKAKEAGKIEQVNGSLTPLANVYTSYELFYHYDYGKGDYIKRILVDKNGYTNPSGGSTLTDEHQNLCQFAEDTYRISNPFVYSSNWIYDDAAAELFLDKKIRWFTEQRLKVRWTSPLADGNFDYIASEVGDQGVLDYTQGLPAGYEDAEAQGLNHSFMIASKNIVINPQGSPHIIWGLIDMGK